MSDARSGADRNTPPSREDAITATYDRQDQPACDVGRWLRHRYRSNCRRVPWPPPGAWAEFHRGTIIQVTDLGALRTDKSERDQSTCAGSAAGKSAFRGDRPEIAELHGKHAARPAECSSHDAGKGPGCSPFSRADGLRRMRRHSIPWFDQSIHYRPQTITQVRPFVIGQVLGPKPFGQRSLQKVRACCAFSSPATVPPPKQSGGPRGHRRETGRDGCSCSRAIAGGDGWTRAICPDESRPPRDPAIDDSSLLLMFGHGNRGRPLQSGGQRISGHQDEG